MDFEAELKNIILLPWKRPDPHSVSKNQISAAFADRYLDHMERVDIKSPSTVGNLTHVMATLGNGVNSVEFAETLIRSGANILRIPTHSSKLSELRATVKAIKRAVEEISIGDCHVATCAVAMETQGAQIRTGALARPVNVDAHDTTYAVQLKEGATIVLTSDPLFEEKSNVKRLYVNTADLALRVLPDDAIYLNGREIHLKVTHLLNNDVHCTVTRGGKLRDHLSIIVRGGTLNLPVLSERDKHVIDLVLSEKLDMIILSSVRNADVIREVGQILREDAEKVLLIAKIETLLAMEYIDEIVEAADGVMLDRTSLAAVTSVDVAFLAQTTLAGKCVKAGKAFLIAGDVPPRESLRSCEDVTPGEMNDIHNMVQVSVDVVVLDQPEHNYQDQRSDPTTHQNHTEGDTYQPNYQHHSNEHHKHSNEHHKHSNEHHKHSNEHHKHSNESKSGQHYESKYSNNGHHQSNQSKYGHESNDSNHNHNLVDILKKMLKKCESVLWLRRIYDDLRDLTCPPLDPAHGTAISCVQMSLKCQAAAIIVVTCSGYSAKLIARYRPQCPILAVTSTGYVARHLNLYRNIRPLHYIRKPQADWAKDVDCRIQFAIQYGMEEDMINPGDPLVLINGWRRGAGFTNTMRVVYAPMENIRDLDVDMF